jgi:hypothetical protein
MLRDDSRAEPRALQTYGSVMIRMHNFLSLIQDSSLLAVSRYRCKSELYAADLLLDVNSDIYPLAVSNRYTIRLSMTLLPDVSMQKDEFDPVRAPTAVQSARLLIAVLMASRGPLPRISPHPSLIL